MPHAGWPMSAADRDSVPAAVTADLFLCRRHSNTQRKSGSVSVEPLSPGVYKVLFDPSRHLWWVWGLILNVIFFPSFHLVGDSYLPLNVGYLFMVRSNILLLMVVQQWVAVLVWQLSQFFCYSKRNLLINWWSDKYIHNNVSQASINFLKIMLSIGLLGIILKISSFPSVRFEISREIHKMK